ncbi:hypothetical protein [Dactylosporangium darangshiense]|uniref:hypothetical protein n=1 Tax=Dactylosporangium darangshiense TaxID=579108 RepID=UPI00362848AE
MDRSAENAAATSSDGFTIGVATLVGGRFGSGGGVPGEAAPAQASETSEAATALLDSRTIRAGASLRLLVSQVRFAVTASKPGGRPDSSPPVHQAGQQPDPAVRPGTERAAPAVPAVRQRRNEMAGPALQRVKPTATVAAGSHGRDQVRALRGGALADGTPIVSSVLPDAGGLALVSPDDAEVLGKLGLIPAGGSIPVFVHGAATHVMVTVVQENGSPKQVRITADQLATIINGWLGEEAAGIPVALIACGIGGVTAGFARRLASALGRDVFAPSGEVAIVQRGDELKLAGSVDGWWQLELVNGLGGGYVVPTMDEFLDPDSAGVRPSAETRPFGGIEVVTLTPDDTPLLTLAANVGRSSTSPVPATDTASPARTTAPITATPPESTPTDHNEHAWPRRDSAPVGLAVPDELRPVLPTIDEADLDRDLLPELRLHGIVDLVNQVLPRNRPDTMEETIDRLNDAVVHQRQNPDGMADLRRDITAKLDSVRSRPESERLDALRNYLTALEPAAAQPSGGLARTPEQLQQWVRESGEVAARLMREPRGPEDVRASLLFARYPLWAIDVDRDPAKHENDDYLPLVQEVFDVSEVTPELLTRLDEHIKRIGDWPHITVDALKRREAFTQEALREIGLPSQVEDRIAAAVTGTENIRWDDWANRAPATHQERGLELRSLVRAFREQENFGFDDADPEHFRRLNRVIDSVYRHYDKHRAEPRPSRPVHLDDLEMLLRHKYGARVPLNWDQVSRIADRVIEREKSRLPKVLASLARTGPVSLARAVRLSRTQLYRRRVAAAVRRYEKQPGRTDSKEKRRDEREVLWRIITLAIPGARDATDSVTVRWRRRVVYVSKADLDVLVWARRKYYADPRDRKFRSASDYESMMLEILGKSGPVSATDLVVLAEKVREAYSWVRRRAPRVSVRTTLVDRVLAGWRRDMPGPGPTQQGDRSRLVTGFHTVGQLDFVPELTGWLNGIVPLADGAIETSEVRRKLTSGIAQATDEGIELRVSTAAATATGIRRRDFDIRLYAVAKGRPLVQPASLLPFKTSGSTRFSGKQENRIYRYLDAAQSMAGSAGWSVDAGLAGRLALDPAQTSTPSSKDFGHVDLSLTGGYGRSSGSRHLSGMADSDYQFLRIKEPLGWVDLEVAWVARVQDRDTGRWRDFTYRRADDGKPRVDKVSYSVAQFQLPYTTEQVGGLNPEAVDNLAPGLADNVDPGYLQRREIAEAEEFPLWKLDHAVTRVQLADKVLSQLRLAKTEQGEPVLSLADYMFWKPVLEAKLTNDAFAIALADILHPPTGRNFQRVFREVLERDGRRLSLALYADKEQPISSVTRISEISRSGETRFDRILASVGKSLSSRDALQFARGTLLTRVSLFGDFFGVGARGQHSPWRKGKQHTRHHRAWLTRAKRLVGRVQVVLLDFDVRLDVSHATHGGPTRTGTSNIDGYAHAMVAAADLRRLNLASEATLQQHRDEDQAEDETRTERARPNRTKTWWNLGAGFGLGVDFPDRLNGVDTLYNQIVTAMVKYNYLPAVAKGREGETPWQALHRQPLTGETLNRPGEEYRNWRTLIKQLSEESLRRRGDDVLDMDAGAWGVTWTFRSPAEPNNRRLDFVLGLSADIVGAGQHAGIPGPGYEVQYSHTSVDTFQTKRTAGKTTDASGYGLLDLTNLPTGKLPHGLPARLQGAGSERGSGRTGPDRTSPRR